MAELRQRPHSKDPDADQNMKVESFSIAQDVPVTSERLLPEGLEKKLPNPGLPRASTAPDAEHPEGTKGYHDPNKTVLQQHISFFDPDGDGIIRPWDTFVGFWKLGFNPVLCVIAVIVIHPSFSWISQPYWLPNPLLWIYVDGIHRGKHGSDSETIDTEGRFVPQKFEEIFSKYDKGNKGALTFWELGHMLRGQRNVVDPFGWFAAFFEWGATWILCADDDWIVQKEAMRGVIDGSLFYQIAEQRRQGRRKSHNSSVAMLLTAIFWSIATLITWESWQFLTK